MAFVPVVVINRTSPIVVRPLYGAGAKGETGPAGPTGPAGDGGYEHTQSSPVSSITVNHDLGRKPVVEVRSIGGVKLDCSWQHLNNNQVLISFNSPQAFTASFV